MTFNNFLLYLFMLINPAPICFLTNIYPYLLSFQILEGCIMHREIWILRICALKFEIGSEIQSWTSFMRLQVAKDPSGKEINALQQHIKNLLAPSTPFFFNTLYDPYREGTDFVRGYPFSLREGVPTAVSHGLWLNIPDYDAPTQLVKPLEKNTR